MNRFKLVCLLIILGIVGILLGQNRELLSLKLFCPDVTSESCLYRTPALPLAVWISLFAIAGIISSLLWQFLARLATPAPKYSDRKSRQERRQDKTQSKQKVDFTRPKTVTSSNTIPTSDWEESQNEDWETDSVQTKRNEREFIANKSFERDRTVPLGKQTPDVAGADSTYSYKFREAKPKKREDEPSLDNKTDEVYDVNYRTVSPPSVKNSDTIQDDEEWI